MPDQTLPQSRLTKCLIALGRHPELPGDLLAAGNAARSPAPGLLGEAGPYRQAWIATVAAYWFLHRHAPTWPLVPSFGQYHLDVLLQCAVSKGWTWDDVIATVADIESHPPTPPTRIMVEAVLHKIDSLMEQYESTPLFSDLGYSGTMSVREWRDAKRPFPVSETFVEVTHRMRPGASLDEYLASARRAWQSGQIKQHLPNPRTSSSKPGTSIEYAEHVDLYSKWFDHHRVQRQPTSRFVDAVAAGVVPIKGWAQPPSRSAIEQRLRDARAWLHSEMQGEYESLDALLGCAKRRAEDSFEVHTPDGRHVILMTFVTPPDNPAKEGSGLAEAN